MLNKGLMSLLRSRAIQQPTETQCATEPLPLFRPEVLSRHERFFGEVLVIRPFSLGLLACLIIGVAALTYCVLFFGSYTETAPVRLGLWRRPTLESSRSKSPRNQAPVGRRRRLYELFEPTSARGKSQP